MERRSKPRGRKKDRKRKKDNELREPSGRDERRGEVPGRDRMKRGGYDRGARRKER